MAKKVKAKKPRGIVGVVELWEDRLEKIKWKRKHAGSMRYEAIYDGKIMQIAECIAELKLINTDNCEHEWAWNETMGNVCWLCLAPKPSQENTPDRASA